MKKILFIIFVLFMLLAGLFALYYFRQIEIPFDLPIDIPRQLDNAAQPTSGLTAIPGSGSDVELRIIDHTSVGLTSNELQRLDNLARSVGEIYYNTNVRYDPAVVESILKNITADELAGMVDVYFINSTFISHQVFDVLLDPSDEQGGGDILVCYLINYESRMLDKDEYYFIVNIKFAKERDIYICMDTEVKGAFIAADYVIRRDNLTGDIKLESVNQTEDSFAEDYYE